MSLKVLEKLNRAAFDKGYAAIEKAKPERVIMRSFEVDGGKCGTAYCIGGWMSHANRQKVLDEAASLLNPDMDPALGKKLDQLLYMKPVTNGTPLGLHIFDDRPAANRKEIVLRVLDTFLETGRVKWRSIIRAHDKETGYVER